MKMQMGCFGCLIKMLNNSTKTLNNCRSKDYSENKFHTTTVISYKNYNFRHSPDRNGILFICFLLIKRYNESRTKGLLKTTNMLQKKTPAFRPEFSNMYSNFSILFLCKYLFKKIYNS
ncbi:hypothetical protein SAMN05444481_11764 [Flavobacterium frigidimaris]|jgi:hypothetical protein|nr:hypothetical protein SAMN05444481_11764 [Flavobacterium frigidimaris]